jgi:C4-dicarboxylate transporter DctM subunit
LSRNSSSISGLANGQDGAAIALHPLDLCEQWLAAVARVLASLGVLGMLFASAATVVDVLLRWLFDSGVFALNEIVAMAFAVAVAACVPAGTASRVGITVDILEKRFSRRAVAWLRAIGAVLLLIFLTLLAWRMGAYAADLAAEGRTTIILGLPQAPFFWGTAAMLAFATLVQLVIAANGVRAAIAVDAEAGGRGLIGLGVLAVGAAFTALGMTYGETLARAAQAHPGIPVVVAFLLMWALLLCTIPLACVIGLVGVLATTLFIGFQPTMSALATEAAGFLTNYEVATLPLFLMMGSFAIAAGISDDIYRLAQAVVGRARGGLAMATIGGCAGFGAATGSSLATVATFGRISLPQMQSRGYAPEFAAGCVAAGGTLGALIPPSTPLIIFALLTEASIGQLFVAAIVPGVMAFLFYLAAVAVTLRLNPNVAPSAERADSGAVWAALGRSGPVVILFGTVIGGMYAGIFTATESAAVGVFGAFIIALVRGRLRPATFWKAMAETTASTAMIYTLLFGVLMFSFFIAASGVPDQATAFVGSLTLPHLAVIAIILMLFLALGCVMDSFAVMIIMVPIVTPIISSMGYDLIWWGVINLVVIEIGLVTPPFGLHLFVLKSMLPDLPLFRLYRGVAPFCAADFVKLALLVLFPILTLWLPSTMAR